MVWRLIGRLWGPGSRRHGPANHNRQNPRLRYGHPSPVRVVSVQDGDSLVMTPVNSRGNEEFRLRLYAIDAPEWDQRSGQEARDHLSRIVRNREGLMLEAIDTDQYGRLVGVLYYRAAGRGRSINRIMVEQGYARWYRRFGGRELGLEQAEQEARRRRRGIWGAGRAVAPWEHRRAQRETASRRGCLPSILVGLLAISLGLVACFLWSLPD